MPKDKRPPRNLWDKPHRLKLFLEEVWDTGTDNSKKYIDFDYEDVE